MTESFVRDYIRSHIHLVSILPDAFEPEHAPRGRWFGDDWQAAEQWATQQNALGRNLYWTLNLVTPGLNKKPAKGDIVGVRGFGVDIDPPKGVDGWVKSEALADLIQRGQPSYVIDTGRGIQGVWLATDPATPHDVVEMTNRALSAGFRGDATHNIDRLFRLPGYINYGDAKKRAAGYVPTHARLASPFNGATYDSATILQYFPVPENAPTSIVEELPTGPRPEWTLGDKTDDEIIALARRSRGGLGAMFGDKATFADLWDGNPEVLAKFFPSDSGDDFNRSSADAALNAHLAFWFGADPERMDRVFRKSGLMRDKWLRDSYRITTIGKAVSGCTNVFSVEKKKEEVPTNLPGVSNVLEGEIQTADTGFLTVYEQKEYFKGCVYVADIHEVLTPNGVTMKPDRFKAFYGGYAFEVASEGTPEKNAFIAFTENRLVRFPKVQSTFFDPSQPFGTICQRRNAVNIYTPDPNVKAEPGDVSPFLNHLAKMIPDPEDREKLLTWMASLVQNPGKKFQWAPFIQGVPGNGKSMIGAVLKAAVGPLYVHEPFSDDLVNKFNDWQENKILIIVEELSIGERVELDNNMKTWITQPHIEMQAKGGKKMMRQNTANWIIFSNFQNGIVFSDSQRRYAPFFTDQQTTADLERCGMTGQYFPRLWDWLTLEGGLSYMTHYLRNRPLHPQYDPAGRGEGKARAPRTTSTPLAIAASMGRFEMEVVEAVQSAEQGFREPWISSNALKTLEERIRVRMSPVKRKAALESLGYVQWGRSSIVIMSEGGIKPTLYVKRGYEHLTVEDFIKHQGYSA